MSNVLWISLDASALSLWGCYGNLQGWTPQLDLLASRGIVFDQHYAIQDPAGGLVQALKLQQEVVRRGGIVETISVDAGGTVSRDDAPAWKSLGDRLRSTFQKCADNAGSSLIPCQLPQLTGEPSEADEEEEDHEEQAAVPRGFPYELMSEGERTGIIQDLVFLDEWLGGVLEDWEETFSSRDESWLIITAGRGGSFPFVESQEHSSPAELLRHIPLIVYSASEFMAGERVRGLTSDSDLKEVLSQLLEGDETGDLAWRGFLKGQTVSGALLWRDATGEVTLRTPEAVFVASDSPQVHHMPEDRWRLQDVSHSEQELTDKLQAELAEQLAQKSPGASC